MAGFFSNLLSKITSAFKSKDLDENINNFQGKIDTIINDLLLPYTNPETKLASTDRFREMINLLDPKKCNKIAMTLSSNLDKNYTKLQIEQFASSILIGKEQKDCIGEDCEDNEDVSVSKYLHLNKDDICLELCLSNFNNCENLINKYEISKENFEEMIEGNNLSLPGITKWTETDADGNKYLAYKMALSSKTKSFKYEHVVQLKNILFELIDFSSKSILH